VRTRYAEAAIMEMTATLKAFDPEISKEKLSDDMYGILHSDAISGKVGHPMRAALRQYVPRDRREWLASDIERHIARKRAQLRVLRAKVAKALGTLGVQVVQIAKEPTTHVVVLSSVSGAVVVGVAGGAIGLASGAAIGTAAGVAPALLTFGLSVPIGAAVGSGIGMGTGATLGALLGLAGGGAVGGAGCVYHVEIEAGVLHVSQRALETAACARTKAFETTSFMKVKAIDAAESVQTKAAGAAAAVAETTASAARTTRSKATDLQALARSAAQEPRVQVTAASAAGGAVVAGAGGGFTGLLAGGAAGAACGTIPAIFTLGLSIPVGAALGGGAGLAAGTVAGGTFGLLGGGATGYALYPRRELIHSGLTDAYQRVSRAAVTARGSATCLSARLLGGPQGKA